MAVSLSVKDVPDVLAVALRERAKQHHRSLQGELLDILETAVRPQPFQGLALWKHAQVLGLKGRRGESTRMVRQDRGPSMTRLVVDASAMAAIAFGEPEGEALARRLDGAAVFAPTLLAFELANTAWKKIRREPTLRGPILASLDRTLSPGSGIIWQAVTSGRHVRGADTWLLGLRRGVCVAGRDARG